MLGRAREYNTDVKDLQLDLDDAGSLLTLKVDGFEAARNWGRIGLETAKKEYDNLDDYWDSVFSYLYVRWSIHINSRKLLGRVHISREMIDDSMVDASAIVLHNATETIKSAILNPNGIGHD